jgi:hypothetical protein
MMKRKRVDEDRDEGEEDGSAEEELVEVEVAEGREVGSYRARSLAEFDRGSTSAHRRLQDLK